MLFADEDMVRELQLRQGLEMWIKKLLFRYTEIRRLWDCIRHQPRVSEYYNDNLKNDSSFLLWSFLSGITDLIDIKFKSGLASSAPKSRTELCTENRISFESRFEFCRGNKSKAEYCKDKIKPLEN